MEEKQNFPRATGFSGKILIALLFILSGILLFARNMGWITSEVFDLIVSWHSLLILLGIYAMIRRHFIGGIILFLAAYISSKSREMRQWKKMVIPFLFAIPIIVIVGIENLSTCIILLAISFIMIFVATPLLVPFVVIGLIGVAGAGGLLLTQGYRMERITVWLDPAASEKGHQTIQGLYAIGSGGLFGKGLGQSMQKLGFLPEANNDMIFSVICEELGLFGALCVLALFFALIWRFMVIAVNAPDLYGSMIVVGVIAHIGIQVFINIAVATNTIPNTGIPLPFISYGGSSLVFMLLEMGLVLSVSRYINVKK